MSPDTPSTAAGRRGRPPFAPAWPLLLAFLAGCGDGDRVPLYPASGRVLVDGRPAASVQVRLRPADRPDDLDALRPFAVTDEDGGFRLGTDDEGDGAPAGRYRATLFWPDRPPGPSPPTDRLGGRYDDPGNSPFVVTIAEGENALDPFRAETPATPPSRPPTPPGADADADGLGVAPPP